MGPSGVYPPLLGLAVFALVPRAGPPLVVPREVVKSSNRGCSEGSCCGCAVRRRVEGWCVVGVGEGVRKVGIGTWPTLA
jgi:hypothetical protein